MLKNIALVVLGAVVGAYIAYSRAYKLASRFFTKSKFSNNDRPADTN